MVNFDLLKCMCMLMIVGIHFYTHGLFADLGNYQEVDMNMFGSYDRSVRSVNFLLSEYAFIVFCISVNCFVLITGYFMARSRLKVNRIVGIWVQTLFYSIAIPCIMWFFIGDAARPYLLKGLTPVSSNIYWFVTIYIGLMMMSPFLILLVNKMEKAIFKQFLLMFGLINITFIWKIPWGDVYGGGTSLLFFMFLFCMGGYIRIFGIKRGKGHYGKYFFLLSLLLFVWTLTLDFSVGVRHHTGPYHVINRYNGFLFFLSVLAFLWVKDMKMDNRILFDIVTKISPYVFGVYLITQNPEI